ncbi:VC0807 family protein [Streptomyces sp. NPDC048650]|uniref:VC0807 family protein n=1 Tax=unclassified Streptomyces TaxID=2593676 RepID=UPI00371FD931
MSENPGERRSVQARRKLHRVLLINVVAPLVVFYGLRRLGADQFLALLAGAALPAVEAVHGVVARRRVGGLQIFMLATMALTVAMSFVTGSPRAMLIRNGWGMAALGGWMLITLLSRRPFLYEAARVVLDEDRRRTWRLNWERHPPFRRLLWVCSAFWGAACLVDTVLRVVMAMTLPIDLVPILDDALLAATVVVILLFQRLHGRSFLRRHGLRRDGVQILPRHVEEPAR